jgi:hypothetical protein
MQSSKPTTSSRYKRSVIIAFHKLLKAARDGSEVLLLDMRDCYANLSIQEYNDGTSENDAMFESAYGQFVDGLAARFDMYAGTQGTGQPKMPSASQLAVAGQLLESLLERGDT